MFLWQILNFNTTQSLFECHRVSGFCCFSYAFYLQPQQTIMIIHHITKQKSAQTGFMTLVPHHSPDPICYVSDNVERKIGNMNVQSTNIKT